MCVCTVCSQPERGIPLLVFDVDVSSFSQYQIHKSGTDKHTDSGNHHHNFNTRTVIAASHTRTHARTHARTHTHTHTHL